MKHSKETYDGIKRIYTTIMTKRGGIKDEYRETMNAVNKKGGKLLTEQLQKLGINMRFRKGSLIGRFKDMYHEIVNEYEKKEIQDLHEKEILDLHKKEKKEREEFEKERKKEEIERLAKLKHKYADKLDERIDEDTENLISKQIIRDNITKKAINSYMFKKDEESVKKYIIRNTPKNIFTDEELTDITKDIFTKGINKIAKNSLNKVSIGELYDIQNTMKTTPDLEEDINNVMLNKYNFQEYQHLKNWILPNVRPKIQKAIINHSLNPNLFKGAFYVNKD